MTTADILSRLKSVKKTGDGWMARCPGHADKTPSLSIMTGDDGRTLINCKAGCPAKKVCAGMGLTLANLFCDKPQRNRQPKKIVATYDYNDAAGKLIFQVCRYQPKDFKQRRPDPAVKDGWTWKTKGINKVLFRLPEILTAITARRRIYVTGGEKDTLAMVDHGFDSTTHSGGEDITASKWLHSYTETLRGVDVVIVADKDATGRAHAAAVAQKLVGIAASVRTIELPDMKGNFVKDAHDFFAAGGKAAEVQAIAEAAPIFEPSKTIERTSATLESETYNFAATTAWIRGQILKSLQNNETPVTVKNSIVATDVVNALARIGRFYFHADRRDFDSAMFFDGNRKRLERVRGDGFAAWLAEWLTVNRATVLFKFIHSAVETAALSGPHTTGILPECYWAARQGAFYLSTGDGAIVKITAETVCTLDNGTDGVLFATGKTLAPWTLTTPRDVFESCALFRNAHCGASHGKLLLQLWLYSFATMPRGKPPLGAIGEVGSGKTRTLKAAAELYGIPFRAVKVEERLESNFWPNVNEGGLLILDNADSKCRWLADAIAAAATDGCSERRKLYTNSETFSLRANAWMAVTSANPTFGNDAGLADRLLICRMERRADETGDRFDR